MRKTLSSDTESGAERILLNNYPTTISPIINFARLRQGNQEKLTFAKTSHRNDGFQTGRPDALVKNQFIVFVKINT
jgi:hypothetical protein